MRIMPAWRRSPVPRLSEPDGMDFWVLNGMRERSCIRQKVNRKYYREKIILCYHKIYFLVFRDWDVITVLSYAQSSNDHLCRELYDLGWRGSCLPFPEWGGNLGNCFSDLGEYFPKAFFSQMSDQICQQDLSYDGAWIYKIPLYFWLSRGIFRIFMEITFRKSKGERGAGMWSFLWWT